MALSRDELAARLALDYKAAAALKAPCLEPVRAYPDQRSFDHDQPITTEAEGSKARIYRVRYNITTLKGPGEFIEGCIVKFDLLAAGNYPMSPPLATVISRPTPWSPHFHTGGSICIGSGWTRARGKMLLAQLIIHIAKLLNFDEPGHGPGYVGYNAGASRYWHSACLGEPLDPDLVYPDLSAALVHGIQPSLRFAPLGKALSPAPPAPTSPHFAPVSSRRPAGDSRFRPAVPAVPPFKPH